MNSQTMKLPIIDFSDLKPGSLQYESVKKQVREAMEEHGCFQASFDEIHPNLRRSLFDGLQQLFDLPLETKLKNMADKPYRGYIGQHVAVPLYESLGIYDVLDPGNIESFTNLMWSDGNPTFSNIIQFFTEKISELDKIVRRMIVESLKLEKYMDEHMEFMTNNGFRVQKYNAPQSHETKLGLPSHTDKDFLNILYQNGVTGLQILTKDGEWITIEPTLNSFIVMNGDYFYAWTNGRLHSPHHRVMMTGDKPRYSIGLSSFPKEGYVIKAPEEMVDDEHPLLFKPFNHDDFFEFFYSEGGRKSSDPLKDYCGA